jgi:putative ABC transport system permease protein
MHSLDRKLLRNLGTMRLQIVAIVLIIACGVASFVTLLTSYRGLQQSRDAYYARYRMADLWAPVKRVPRSRLADLEQIPGVRRVQGRISAEVILDMPRLAQPASGRMISVPARREPILNDLHLVRGRWFTGDGIREVLVDQRFAEAHGLDVGDSISAVMNNRKEALAIAGIALCPEFVYLIGGAAQLLPDAERFTVLWISEPFAEAVFDYEDACNDIVASLERDASREEIVERFDLALDRYGAFGAARVRPPWSPRSSWRSPHSSCTS